MLLCASLSVSQIYKDEWFKIWLCFRRNSDIHLFILEDINNSTKSKSGNYFLKLNEQKSIILREFGTSICLFLLALLHFFIPAIRNNCVLSPKTWQTCYCTLNQQLELVSMCPWVERRCKMPEFDRIHNTNFLEIVFSTLHLLSHKSI